MERIYEEAFVEIEEVLKLMPIDLVSKIPVQFRQMISENKATNYKIDVKEPLEEQKLKKETIVILGLIYRDFLASPEESERLQMEDIEELNEIEQKMQEQYDIQNIFEKKKRKKEMKKSIENNHDSKDLTVYKETGFLGKFFSTIKRIFNRNKF